MTSEDNPPRQSFLEAFNQGEAAVAELIGAEKAREIFARQKAVADCRRRAQSNAELLNRRIGRKS